MRHPARSVLQAGARPALLATLAALGACTPLYDWRSVPLPDTELVAELPCRPASFERELAVAGVPLKLFMLSCQAGGVTYGVATADVGDPTRVDAVLHGLMDSAGATIRSADFPVGALNMHGATPFSGSSSARLHGKRPDGAAVEEVIRVFARGSRVFQASVVGGVLPDSAVKPFEEGLRFDLDRRASGPM